MKNRFLKTSTLLVSLFALSALSSADSFWVLDQQGLPVKNAVLEFINPIPTPKPDPKPNTLIMDQVDKLFKPDILVVQPVSYTHLTLPTTPYV